MVRKSCKGYCHYAAFICGFPFDLGTYRMIFLHRLDFLETDDFRER